MRDEVMDMEKVRDSQRRWERNAMSLDRAASGKPRTAKDRIADALEKIVVAAESLDTTARRIADALEKGHGG